MTSEVEESQTRLVTGGYGWNMWNRSQWVKATLAEIQPQNHQNFQIAFLAKAPGVNGLNLVSFLLIFVIRENEI